MADLALSVRFVCFPRESLSVAYTASFSDATDIRLLYLARSTTSPYEASSCATSRAAKALRAPPPRRPPTQLTCPPSLPKGGRVSHRRSGCEPSSLGLARQRGEAKSRSHVGGQVSRRGGPGAVLALECGAVVFFEVSPRPRSPRKSSRLRN